MRIVARATCAAVLLCSAPTTWCAELLKGVGQLHVPAQRFENGYAKHYHENCSATLVAPSGDPRSDTAGSQIIVSAWHCLERYRDLSRPLVFTAQSGDTREATVIKSGGSMRADWAILRLDSILPDPALLPPSNGPRDALPAASKIERASRGKAPRVTLAGYPSQDNQTVRRLQIWRGCASQSSIGIPTASQPHDSIGHRSDDRSKEIGNDRGVSCALRKGASGGGAFSHPEPVYFAGVISRGDGETLSVYVPLARFEKALRATIENYRQ